MVPGLGRPASGPTGGRARKSCATISSGASGGAAAVSPGSRAALSHNSSAKAASPRRPEDQPAACPVPSRSRRSLTGPAGNPGLAQRTVGSVQHRRDIRKLGALGQVFDRQPHAALFGQAQQIAVADAPGRGPDVGHRILGTEQAQIEIDDEGARGRVIDRHARHGLDHAGNRCAIRDFSREAHDIVEVVTLARQQRFGGQPIRDDIVVELVLDRDLDQVDGALAPIPLRRDPDRGPHLITRLGILVAFEVAGALRKAKAQRVLVHKGRGLQRRMPRQHPPQPFLLAGQHLQTVAVMHRRAVIIDARAVGRPEPVHRGQGHNARILHVIAREQRDAGIKDRLGAGCDAEFERARDRAAIQQRINQHRAFARSRLGDPEVPEHREFLALGLPVPMARPRAESP